VLFELLQHFLEITNNILPKKKITLQKFPSTEKIFTSTIPSVNGDYKSLEKGKNEKHLKHKKKKKTKNRIFFNSLLQTALNPYLQVLFLQT